MSHLRARRSQRKTVDDGDVVPYLAATGADIGRCYATYVDELRPLSDFDGGPVGLTAATLSNGDVVLETSDHQEASFDVIGVVVGSCLEAPPGFSKTALPFFRRWVKVAAVGEPYFAAAIDATKVLYNFMALHSGDARPPPQFLVAGIECLRPSAVMLTSLETNPTAMAVEIPPLSNRTAIEAAIRAGHGRYVFASDNEVVCSKDEEIANGDIVRGEITPSSIRAGQIVQVRMKFRLLKQEDETFVFREMLRSVSILHPGFSLELARKIASQTAVSHAGRGRNVQPYTVARIARAASTSAVGK